MDERDPGRGRGFGQMGWTIGVDGERRFRLQFGAIDGGVGGGVDDQHRPVAVDDAPDRIPIGNIEIAVAEPDQRHALRRPRLHQLAADLAAATDDQDGRAIRIHRVGTGAEAKPAAIVAPAQLFPPRPIGDVPLDRLTQSGIEGFARRPAEVARQLRSVDRVALIVPRTVVDEGDQVAAGAGAALGRHLVD